MRVRAALLGVRRQPSSVPIARSDAGAGGLAGRQKTTRWRSQIVCGRAGTVTPQSGMTKIPSRFQVILVISDLGCGTRRTLSCRFQGILVISDFHCFFQCQGAHGDSTLPRAAALFLVSLGLAHNVEQ